MHKSMWLTAVAGVLFPLSVMAQNPHFTACGTTVINGQVTVAGQVAGLGNQSAPLVLTVSTTALCLDGTVTPPTVLGSAPVIDGAVYPRKNGNRKFTIPIDAGFVLPCDPPAEIVFANIEVCDLTHDICTACPLFVE